MENKKIKNLPFVIYRQFAPLRAFVSFHILFYQFWVCQTNIIHGIRLWQFCNLVKSARQSGGFNTKLRLGAILHFPCHIFHNRNFTLKSQFQFFNERGARC